jgi:hypothetical protein
VRPPGARKSQSKEKVMSATDVAATAPRTQPGSLADRMRARRDLVEAQHTKTLDIPGYEGVLAAEYRMLSWATIRKIAARHDGLRDPAMQEVYAAADTLIRACEEIHEVRGDGQLRATGERWKALAQAAGAKLPDDATDRQALIALFVHDTRVMEHYRDYEQWIRGRTGEVEDDVVRDFGETR